MFYIVVFYNTIELIQTVRQGVQPNRAASYLLSLIVLI